MKVTQASPINFTSKIKVENLGGFLAKTADFPPENSIDSPWGANEIIRAKKVKTLEIRSCTAGGIVIKKRWNKREVIMFHLSPEDENRFNKDFEKIKQTILTNLGENKKIKGFLLGSKKTFPLSVKMFANLEALFKELNIPYSKLQGLPRFAKAHLAYNGRKDKWIVYVIDCINKSNNKKPVIQLFDTSLIHPTDKLVVKASRVSRLKQLLFR